MVDAVKQLNGMHLQFCSLQFTEARFRCVQSLAGVNWAHGQWDDRVMSATDVERNGD